MFGIGVKLGLSNYGRLEVLETRMLRISTPNMQEVTKKF
jgi:hypothetical protein